MWEKDLFKNLEMVGNEYFDWLFVIASSLEKGFIFFESEENLFGLRIVNRENKEKYGIHSRNCPSNIFLQNLFHYNFFRVYLIIQIIKNSCLSNSEKIICILIFENKLKEKKKFFGTKKLGIRLLIKEFINLITFKSNFHELLFLLTYSIYAKFLRNKNLKSLKNKN